MTFTLRPYQKEAVEAVYQHLRDRDNNPCIVCPAGTGKSLIIAQIVTDAITRWDGRIIVLAHVKELLQQNAEKIQKLCPDIDIGIYSAGLHRRDTKSSVIVAGIQSVYKRACELGPFDLAIVDESHLLSSEGEGIYKQFLNETKAVNPNLRILGLTATPYRLKGGMICKPENILNHVCYEVGIKEMIVQGYLSRLKTKSGKVKADLDGLHIRGGEFVATEMSSAMDQGALVRNACREIVELTQDRKSVLVFTTSLAHCKHVASEIAKISNMECGIITGSTPSCQRAEIIARFRGQTLKSDLFGSAKGPLKFLANVNVLTTGFDAPNIDCVVLLRPTASVGLLVQMIGRGTRLYPGKSDCLILDYGSNILRHGPIDAVVLPDQRNSTGQAPAKECPKCQALIHAAYRVCPDCGFEFPPPKTSENLSDKADTFAILSGEIEDTEYDVTDVYYGYHTKRNAGPESLPTMRVEYQIGWQRYQSEWICFEHTGFARNKAVNWWKLRSNEPVPDTVEEAVELANNGALADTFKITIRSISGQKYDKIIAHQLSPKPPLLDGSDERETEDVPEYIYDYDEEIPF